MRAAPRSRAAARMGPGASRRRARARRMVGRSPSTVRADRATKKDCGSGEDVARAELRRSGPERRGRLHAHAAHAKRDRQSPVSRAAEVHLAAGRAEHELAILADLEAGALEAGRERPGLVAEAEHAVLQPGLRGGHRDVVAIELSVAIGELERDPVARVEARGGGNATAPEPQAVTGALGPHAHHHPAQRERIDPLAAVRILVVNEAVAVVVHAVAADLGGVAGSMAVVSAAAGPARPAAAPPAAPAAGAAGSTAAGAGGAPRRA